MEQEGIYFIVLKMDFLWINISGVALKQCKKLLKFKKYKLDKNYDLINSNSSKLI